MFGQLRSCCAIAIAASLIAAPTGALAGGRAALPLTAPQPVPSAPVSQWLTLSAMTSTSPDASAAVVRQGQAKNRPPLAPMAEIMSTIALAIWILLEDHDGEIDLEPISP